MSVDQLHASRGCEFCTDDGIPCLYCRIRKLEEALAPFVVSAWPDELADVLWGHLPDDEPITITLPLGVHRRARSVLSEKPQEAA